jgi:FlaA1/EpsC-like NDP-sugar epimerase
MSTTAAISDVSSTRVGSGAFTRSLTHGSIILSDLAAVLIAGSLSVFARYSFHAQFAPGDYVSFIPAVFIFFATFALSGLYPGVATSPIEEFRLILRASTISFLLLIGTTFFLRKGILASRLVMLLAWALTIVLVPICRRVIRRR